MQNSKRRELKVTLIGWVVIPVFFMFSLVNDALTKELTPGWSPKDISQEKSPYTKPFEVEKSPIQPLVWDGKGMVTLFFDDAWSSQYANAFPLVEKYGYNGAVAVPTDFPGYDGYISWDNLRKMQAAGWEIVSHSVDHDCDYLSKGSGEIEKQLKDSKHRLTLEGLRSDHFVSPCGKNSPELQEISRKYYKSLRLIEENINIMPVKDPYDLEAVGGGVNVKLENVKWWISQAKSRNMWLIIMFHQVDEQNHEYGATPARLEEILQTIKQMNLQVVLPSEALSVYEKN